MRTRLVILFLVLVAFCTAAFVGCGSSKPAPKPLGSDQTDNNKAAAPPAMPSRMIIGYYENPYPGTPDQTGSFPSMKSFAGSMTSVAPFWYRAKPDGSLETKESQIVYDTAKSLGLKILPLITNKTGSTDSVLGDPAIRTKVIDNIVKIVKEKPYDGANIDFELLPPKHKDNLTAFIAELYSKMKPLNKTLIVSVFPKVDVAEDVAGAYDYKALAANADFLQIMSYDYHWSTSKPGPIAPIDWYEKNLQYAIQEAGGPHKIIFGLGAYGYDWPQSGPAETVRYADSIVLAEKYNSKIMFDEKAQVPYFKYKDHEVWFENAKSTAAKLDILAKYNPAGLAIWRIGQEQPEIWDLINKKFPKQQ